MAGRNPFKVFQSDDFHRLLRTRLFRDTIGYLAWMLKKLLSGGRLIQPLTYLEDLHNIYDIWRGQGRVNGAGFGRLPL